MAVIIDPAELNEPPEPTHYPWDEWLDGQARRLDRGVDYEITERGFIRLLRRAAWRRGKRVAVRRDGPCMIIRAFPKDGNDAAAG